MDRSLVPQIRLSDVPVSLGALIDTWVARFSAPASHVHLYYFEGSGGPTNGGCEHRVALYTDNQQYMIHAKYGAPGYDYLGCIARSRKPRAGEDHQRGSDLADGRFTYETWFRILADIVSYELVSLAKTARPVPDGLPFPSSPARRFDTMDFDNSQPGKPFGGEGTTA